MTMNEIRSANREQLEEHVLFCRKRLLQLKLEKLSSHVKNNSEFKKLRRTIARIMMTIAASQ